MSLRPLSNKMPTGIAACAATLAVLAPGSAHAQVNYYALGDSYAFGYQTASGVVPGNGNAPLYGYVGTTTNAGAGTSATFAGYLANTLNQRVTVTNLAIPAETTYSYLGTTAPYPTPTHSIQANTNYTSTSQTQRGVFDGLPTNSASVVTLQLGGNDVIDYLYDNIAAGQTVTNSQINTVEAATISNVSTILTDIKAHDNGRIFVLGYADPYPGITSANSSATTLQGYDVYAVQNYNSMLQSLAASLGVTYVNIYTPFVGHEAAYTYINDPTQNTASGNINAPDFHPNATGYSVIASQLEGAAGAPEPGTLALLGGGLLGGLTLTGRRLRRR